MAIERIDGERVRGKITKRHFVRRVVFFRPAREVGQESVFPERPLSFEDQSARIRERLYKNNGD